VKNHCIRIAITAMFEPSLLISRVNELP